jgi:hypothetical protein
VTPLEQCAVVALKGCSMRVASAGKRFRNDIAWRLEENPEYKLTVRQAHYLWFLVDTYRRQIKDPDLRRFGAHTRLTGELPDIYLPGDHAAPKGTEKAPKTGPAVRVKNQAPKTRYEVEMDRGGGRLVL